MQRLNCNLLELKFAAAGELADDMTFTGYGAVFGNKDAYGDVIQPGAFATHLLAIKSGEAPWPVMLLQHGGLGLGSEDMTPIGVWLDLTEDSVGLRVTGRLADTPRGREVYTLMKMQPRPAIDGLSIGYVAKDWQTGSKAGEPRRKLHHIELVEISPVTFPANSRARVTGIKGEAASPSIRVLEQALREAGCSRTQAKAILAGGYKTMPLRDAEEGAFEELTALLRRNIDALSATGADHGNHHQRPAGTAG
ncbi:HK97 family phage prohead protease [Nitratidesulfovibrio vulgaris]|uniref:Prohead serine protease domain-containing protein n=1 Tax=Nitratidesulfovibrio vulgaris (strain DP4) TaxID=391774 RepID=A0A0H3A784_NITV4|nr:HK97 family phage prohead protease [Nitratidesulfovibrio vulgaris]ABM27889.1 prohead peptidase, Unknown type peptidase, MEROPS family U35 [Nitratidesulfovibrio vulgaris DP4]